MEPANPNLPELSEKLTSLDKDIETIEKSKELYILLQRLDLLNKEVSMKVQCCKIQEEKLQRDIQNSEIEKEQENERVRLYKEHCRTLKQEIGEVESIKEKTRVNHENRMGQINKNFEEVYIFID